MSDDSAAVSLPLVQEFLPELSSPVMARLARLMGLVREWNERVNLISRKDVAHLEEHHLLHALTAVRVFAPSPGARIADIGTGGGFPGLPLAIVFPECEFTLVDSIAKKTRAVTAIAEELGLTNVRVVTERGERLRERFDYVFGRAVTALPEFLGWSLPLVAPGKKGQPMNGVFYFKGTRWSEELAGGKTQPTTVAALQEIVPRPFFEGKFLLHFAAG